MNLVSFVFRYVRWGNTSLDLSFSFSVFPIPQERILYPNHQQHWDSLGPVSSMWYGRCQKFSWWSRPCMTWILVVDSNWNSLLSADILQMKPEILISVIRILPTYLHLTNITDYATRAVDKVNQTRLKYSKWIVHAYHIITSQESIICRQKIETNNFTCFVWVWILMFCIMNIINWGNFVNKMIRRTFRLAEGDGKRSL
jgi:hypothetical protein